MEEKELTGSEMVKKKKTGYNPGRRWIIWGLGSGGRHGEKGKKMVLVTLWEKKYMFAGVG